jgi:hypothetical protein
MDPKRARASLNKLPHATGASVEEYRSTLVAMKEEAERLKRMTEKYPVFLYVAGNVYRFEAPEHIDEFVGMLEREISAYRPVPAAV